jgi:hypothetical protein
LQKLLGRRLVQMAGSEEVIVKVDAAFGERTETHGASGLWSKRASVALRLPMPANAPRS